VGASFSPPLCRRQKARHFHCAIKDLLLHCIFPVLGTKVPFVARATASITKVRRIDFVIFTYPFLKIRDAAGVLIMFRWLSIRREQQSANLASYVPDKASTWRQPERC
jgi:hypothetical protein